MTIDHAAALANYLAGKPVAIDKVLQSLPQNIDPTLAATAALRLIGHPEWFVTATPTLPASVIRQLLATDVPGPIHLFLRLAVPEDEAAAMTEAWTRANTALRALFITKRSLEKPERRAELEPLARDPQVLAALQGVVAHIPDPPLAMLAVLAIDASDLSVDALIPSLAPALGQRDVRLERLARLATYVRRTPALAALYDELDEALADRRDASPARSWARAIGIPELPVLAIRAVLLGDPIRNAGEPEPRGLPGYQGGIRIDSRKDPWFSVWVEWVAHSLDRRDDRATRFDHATIAIDQLDIGRCVPEQLPSWLASTARKLGVQWRPLVPITEPATIEKPIQTWLSSA